MQEVYELKHRYVLSVADDGEEVHETKQLGFFTSDEKIDEAIAQYITQSGFQKHPDDFEIYIVEADVDDYNDTPGNFDGKVYYLAHEWYDGEYDYVTDIGYYSTQEKAEAALRLYMEDEELREHPDGFSIDEYDLDKMHWTEGFCSWDEMEWKESPIVHEEIGD